MREVVEKLSAECEHYREMVTSREKAMKVRDLIVASNSAFNVRKVATRARFSKHTIIVESPSSCFCKENTAS